MTTQPFFWRRIGTTSLALLCAMSVGVLWKMQEASTVKNDVVQPTSSIDFGEPRVRRSIMDFAATAAMAWPSLLMRSCGAGSEETYRLTAEEPTLAATPFAYRMIEFKVTVGTPRGQRWPTTTRTNFARVHHTDPDEPGAIPAAGGHLELAVDTTKAPIAFEMTSDLYEQLKRAHRELVQHTDPAVASRPNCCGITSTWVIESCVAGRYEYFARRNPDQESAEGRRFVALRDLMLSSSLSPSAL